MSLYLCTVIRWLCWRGWVNYVPTTALLYPLGTYSWIRAPGFPTASSSLDLPTRQPNYSYFSTLTLVNAIAIPSFRSPSSFSPSLPCGEELNSARRPSFVSVIVRSDIFPVILTPSASIEDNLRGKLWSVEESWRSYLELFWTHFCSNIAGLELVVATGLLLVQSGAFRELWLG